MRKLFRMSNLSGASLLAAAAACLFAPALRGANLSDQLCKDPNVIKRDAFAQACYWRDLVKNESGVIDPALRQQAYNQMQQMKASARRPLGGGITGPGSWTAIGPGNSGGRIRAVVLDPSNASNIWVGSVGGGVFFTSNGGSAWTASNDFLANLAVSSLVLDPADGTHNTLWAGTGEGFFNIDAIQGAGIYKTTNGQSAGATWTQVTGTNTSDFLYVNRLALAGSALLAATQSGVWLAPNTAAPVWTRMVTPAVNWGGVTSAADVKFNPGDSTKAVAGGYGQAWYVSAGDAKLTSATWTLSSFSPAISSGSTVPYGRVELAYAPSSPSTIYAMVDDSAAGGEGWLYQSTNGGANYTRVNTGTAIFSTNGFLGGQGWYDNVIFVNPNDATNVVVGGNILATSTNSGTSFGTLGYGGGSIHPDNHVIVPDPGFNNTSNKIGYIGNDGGLFKVTDITASAGPSGTSLNTNLPITQFYGGTAHNGTGRFTGGTQDNGTPGYTGGFNTWVDWTGGDGGYVAVDQTDGTGNTWYGEYVRLRIERTTSGFVGSSAIVAGGGGGCGALSDANTTNSPFIAPFIMDPNSNTTLYGGSYQVWKSINANAATPCWTLFRGGVSGFPYVSALAVEPGAATHVWVGYSNGEVDRSTDGGGTWTTMSGLPGRQVTRIAIDPNATGTVYVSFSGYSAGNLWRTTNGLAATPSFTNITGSLPAVPIYSVVVSLTTSANIYIGTDLGIFDSQNGNTGTPPTWSVNDGPANVSVRELFWYKTGASAQLGAATHGRSMWVTTAPVPVTLQRFTAD